jgi:hypothetical protein
VRAAFTSRDGSKIAQAALALLEVRFEQPDRAAELLPALLELGLLVGDELLDPALLQLGDGRPFELLEERGVPRDQPAVEQRGADGVLFARELDALVESTGRITSLEAGVPKRAVQRLRHRLGLWVPLRREQRQEVDVRARGELAPSVPAGSHQSQ